MWPDVLLRCWCCRYVRVRLIGSCALHASCDARYSVLVQSRTYWSNSLLFLVSRVCVMIYLWACAVQLVYAGHPVSYVLCFRPCVFWFCMSEGNKTSLGNSELLMSFLGRETPSWATERRGM